MLPSVANKRSSAADNYNTQTLRPFPIQSNDMTFTLKRNGVVVYTDNISDPGTNNNLTYTYTVPAGTNSLTIDIDGEKVPAWQMLIKLYLVK